MKEAVAGGCRRLPQQIVEDVRANDFRYASGRFDVHLAREFGFYGVDRAVDRTRRRRPPI
jgi:hypothetical protein